MAGFRADDESSLVWDYDRQLVRGWTSLSQVASHWEKTFGTECVTAEGARAFSLSVPIDRVRKPYQVGKTKIALTDEQRKALSDRLAATRKRSGSVIVKDS